MSEQEKELRVLRDQIDTIDKKIHELLNERARCAQNVAEVKLKYQGTQDAVFYRPEREAQVLRRVMDRNTGPLEGHEVARLFREIMSVCLALEEPMRVAFLGPEGTFTQQAAQKHFGNSVCSVPLQSLDEVFREVQSGAAHYGVVPIENSAEGMINHTLDLFRRFDLRIVGEVELRAHQHLLTLDEDSVVSRIYAPQQSFAQCRAWLELHYPQAEKIAVGSNLEAARRVAEGGHDCAAIASDVNADRFQLYISATNIEDEPESSTRFLVIGDQEVGPSGSDKTSILISAHNSPGALYKLLEPFNRQQISLTRIETRPAGQGHLFYLDFEGHYSDPVIAAVLRELESGSVELKLLGSYPGAVL
ncbi:prephenate dehydratase [Marinobacterium jannaschii]|uniref:prephenate dehydratase n=1 Tax=Marinobacterium jannaschii TaxID=64970 RepID=UPI00048133B8|nr:prephenate dehydratase [Marinobacterium jannaschii]